MSLLQIGTRGSRLALLQAGLAADALREAGLGPVAIVPISTIGDRDRRRPFSELGPRGVFSSELEEALAEGRIDLAVHSAKDLTTDHPDGMAIVGVLPRGDARDALCGPYASLAELPEGARIGTASIRRAAALRSLRPDLQIESLRGNVETRLRKRRERGLEGIVLAACGLDRLGLADEIGFRFPCEAVLPETGQGFIALQVRAEDALRFAGLGGAGELELLSAERLAAWRLEGGCRAPVATHAERLPGGGIRLRAWVAALDGSRTASADGSGDDPAALAVQIAAEVLAAGGRELVEAARV